VVTPRQPERLEVDGGHVPTVSPLGLRRPAWWGDALCRERHPGADWFAERGHHQRLAAAVAVCQRCLVADECLAFAIAEGIEHGTWGGLIPAQRKALRRTTRPTTGAT
jgi:WhiB family redox-sensing transcriptional regulator